MSTKQGPLNQCEILHPVTGADNCCLCALRRDLAALGAENARLRKVIDEECLELEKELEETQSYDGIAYRIVCVVADNLRAALAPQEE